MTAQPPSLPLFRAPFLFLRHGETEPNRLKLVAGSTDVPLNAAGLRQAEAAAAALRELGIDAIYASPMQRAQDTAGFAARVLGLPITTVPELAERNWGELEGRPRELRAGVTMPPGGEGLEAFTRRTLTGLAKVEAGRRLPLIVAHSGTFRVLCAQLGIAVSETPVENSLPLRFVPPQADGAWTIVAIRDAVNDGDSI